MAQKTIFNGTFDYQKPNQAQTATIIDYRDEIKHLYARLLRLPHSNELNRAIIKLEEVSMWLNKAIVFSEIAPHDTDAALIEADLANDYIKRSDILSVRRAGLAQLSPAEMIEVAQRYVWTLVSLKEDDRNAELDRLKLDDPAMHSLVVDQFRQLSVMVKRDHDKG